MKKLDLIGYRFGRLTVISKRLERANSGGIQWDCICDCGGITKATSGNLRCGAVRSCGCIRPKSVDYSKPRLCKTCGQIQSPESFRRALCPGSKPDARKSECKICADARLREWKEKNPQRVDSYRGRYKERQNQRAKEYSKREVESLSDRYVRRLLRMKDADFELVETKRAQIRLERLIKEMEPA